MRLLSKKYIELGYGREIVKFLSKTSVTYDPRESSVGSSKQYAYIDGESSINNQINSSNGRDEGKREKEIKQYREWKKRKRNENMEDMKSNGKRVRGIGSPILPRVLREEMKKSKRVGERGNDMSPLI